MRIPAVIAALALTLGLLVAPVTTAEAAPSRARYERGVITYTNQARAAHGLRAVSSKKCVEKEAEKRARWMRKHQQLKHSNLRAVLKKCKLRGVGENIAYGYTSGRSVVFDGWMNSPGHRENILTAKYRRIGVGAYVDAKGRWWVAQIFSY